MTLKFELCNQPEVSASGVRKKLAQKRNFRNVLTKYNDCNIFHNTKNFNCVTNLKFLLLGQEIGQEKGQEKVNPIRHIMTPSLTPSLTISMTPSLTLNEIKI